MFKFVGRNNKNDHLYTATSVHVLNDRDIIVKFRGTDSQFETDVDEIKNDPIQFISDFVEFIDLVSKE